MPPTDPPIDVTDILAQPREFAQKLARVERERAELIETVARLRAECNDAQAEAASYKNQQRIVNDRAAEAVVRMITAERELDAARAEVARLTADVDRMADMLRVCECGHHAVAHEGRRFFCNMKGCECAAMRQPAPARLLDDGTCECGHSRGQHRTDNMCMIFPCKCMEYNEPAPAQTYPLDDEPCDNCVHGKKWHWDGGKCQNACPCEQYQPAPATKE